MIWFRGDLVRVCLAITRFLTFKLGPCLAVCSPTGPEVRVLMDTFPPHG